MSTHDVQEPHGHHDHDHEDDHHDEPGPQIPGQGHHDHEHEDHGHEGHEHSAAPAHGHHDHGHDHDHHGHGHGHDHAGHTHDISPDADLTKLKIAAGLLFTYMLGEVVIGFIAHSQALISDAGHMLTDSLALVFSIVAIVLAKRPANGTMSFGFKRVGVLSALVNGVTLLIFGGIMAGYAVWHLFRPLNVDGWYMLFTALVGIVVNVLATYTISKANRQSMAVEGAFQHMLNDTFAFIGTAVAAAIILATGFNRADAIMSLVVAALMLKAGLPLVKSSMRIFLQMTPVHIDTQDILEEIMSIPGVIKVVDLHAWSHSEDLHLLTVNVVVENNCDPHALQDQIQEIARERGLHHHTIQVDRVQENLTEYAH